MCCCVAETHLVTETRTHKRTKAHTQSHLHTQVHRHARKLAVVVESVCTWDEFTGITVNFALHHKLFFSILLPPSKIKKNSYLNVFLVFACSLQQYLPVSMVLVPVVWLVDSVGCPRLFYFKLIFALYQWRVFLVVRELSLKKKRFRLLHLRWAKNMSYRSSESYFILNVRAATITWQMPNRTDCASTSSLLFVKYC